MGDHHCGGDLVEVSVNMTLAGILCHVKKTVVLDKIDYPHAQFEIVCHNFRIRIASRTPRFDKNWRFFCKDAATGMRSSAAFLHNRTWDELVVRVQHSPSNPSLLFVLTSSQPLKGFVGLSVLPGERVIGSMLWKWCVVISSSSTVTYTSVYTDSDPWRFQWVSDDKLEAPQSPRQAPPSPDYVPGPEHPSLPDYVPGLEEPEQAPLSLVYVLEPEYPEYLVPPDAEAPIEDQPLPDDASPTALLPGYVADFDPEEDPEVDPTKYPANGGDDDDDDDKDDEDEGGEEHLALADSTALHTVDPVSLVEDIEAFETDKSAPTPPSPRSRSISIQLHTPMSATTKALIADEARCTRQAWSQAMDCNRAIHAELQAYQAQTSSLQTQLTAALGCFQTLEARKPTHTDDPEDAGSSS
ncbi:hypothetical protein Tco_0875090 [Tanacetum coccineum]|uniref:Uncharacterized protein n=1 Tax=Tanacetum coccineum TaxID=301880 RepID=A0ABQ5BQ79_9ASTR